MATYREKRAEHAAAFAAWRRGDGPRPPPFERHVAPSARDTEPPPPPPRPALDYDDVGDTSVEPPRDPPRPSATEPVTWPSRLIAVINDVHIPNQHPRAWALFRAWHAAVRPHETIVLGDGIDLAAASRFALDERDTPFLVDEFRAFGREMDALAAECGTLTIALGNHEARLAKALAGQSATALRGLRGTSFREIAEANGLTARVAWFAESLEQPGLVRGQFLLQHGDRQAGLGGGGVHLAATAVARGLGQSFVRGHHHRAQMFARTAYGRTAVAVASPCLTRDHDYAGGQSADWQRGWTVLEVSGRDPATATPYVVVVLDGTVSWGGRTWWVP